MDPNLQDTISVVAGSTAGVGQAIAEELAAHGSHVVVNGRTVERGEQVVADIEAAGGSASFKQADINDYEAVEAMMDLVVDTHGTIDVLVPNGAATSGPAPNFFADTPPEEYLAFAEGMLANRLYCIKAALDALRDGGGRVVNISADAGRWPTPGEVGPGMAAAGLMMATKILAAEFGRWEISVNTVSISVTEETPAMDWVLEESPASSVFKSALDRQDFTVEAEDVAETVAFLAGADGARPITGQLLSINGGVSFPG
jgi:3-oxoacyl-[acyl-carrier protein] reductase